MDVTSAESPVKVNIRQVNFWPDYEIREWLDTYVLQQGMTIRGYLLRLIREDMAKVRGKTETARPKALGRKDVARRAIASRGRELVPIEEIYPA